MTILVVPIEIIKYTREQVLVFIITLAHLVKAKLTRNKGS